MRIGVLFLTMAVLSAPCYAGEAAKDAPVQYSVDAAWPKPLPNQWIMGQASGVAVDQEDHIWLIQRPSTLTLEQQAASLSPPAAECCKPAPPVLQFDQEGNLLRSWGGPAIGYDWPQLEHGIYIDPKGFVWIAGSGPQDGQVLKFTQDGKFILQIGKSGEQTNDLDISRLGRPANMSVDVDANEIYIADGYYNHRVIVFDSQTGAFKRMWGAYGVKFTPENIVNTDPSAPPQENSVSSVDPKNPPKSFNNPVHCVKIASDGLVYVCDRTNDRYQIFKKDGTFVREVFIDPHTALFGSVWELAFFPSQDDAYMFNIDGSNGRIDVIKRETGASVGTFASKGPMAGQFSRAHNIAVDSKGNIFTAEIMGQRGQKFLFSGHFEPKKYEQSRPQ